MKNYKILYFVVRIFVIFITIGCTKNEKFALSNKEATQIADSLYSLSYNFISENNIASIEVAEKLLKFSTDNNLIEAQAKAYYLLGYVNRLQGNYNIAVNNFYELLIAAKKIDHNEFIYSSLYSLGNIYYTFSDYGNALSLFEEALKNKIVKNDQKKIADLSCEIGLCNEMLGNHKEAKVLFYNALEKYYALANENKVAYTHVLLGINFKESNLYDSALLYYHNAIKISNKPKIVADANNNIGNVYQLNKQYSLAKTFYHEALKTQGILNATKGLINNNLGETYLKQDSIDLAVNYFQIAAQLLSENKFHREGILAHSNLYNIFKKIGDVKNELKHSSYLAELMPALIELKEKLEKLSLNLQLQQLEIQQRREKEQTRLLTERMIYTITFAVLIVGIIWVIVSWRKYFNEWNEMKEKYNQFVTKYNDFLVNYRATIAKQLKLNRELSVLANTEIRNPAEFLWRNPEKDNENNGDDGNE